MISSKEEYKTKVEQLKLYSKAYYIDNKPLVTDEEYDKLYTEVKEYEKNNPYDIDRTSPTQRVGDDINNGIKHIEKMYSMEDAFTEDEVIAWYNKLPKDTIVYLNAKLDGASINILYDNGKVVSISTRGNGLIGEDITHLKDSIDGILENINYKGKIEIRGEVVIPIKDFENINLYRTKNNLPPLSNPRNAASGALMLKDKEEVKNRKLKFIPWGVGYNTLNNKTLEEDFNFLYNLGFYKNPYDNKANNIKLIFNYYKYLHKVRDKIEYMLDGFVISVNDKDLQNKLGYTNKYPKWRLAYKFPAIERVTTLKGVLNQIGRTGVITPVGLIEPVDIDGVTVSRVTLNNYDYIKSLDLKINDKISIIRSGDVIPKLISVFKDRRDNNIKDIYPPKLCPDCKSKLTGDLKQLKCTNDNCNSRVINYIIHFVSRQGMDINGLSSKTISILYNKGLLNNITDIYKLPYMKDKLINIDRLGELSVDNIIDSIENGKTRECHKFIYALGIDGIGEKTARDICNKFKENVFNITLDDLLSIDGIGEKTAINYIEFINKNKNTINKLLDILNIIYPKDITNNMYKDKNIVISGSFEIPRDKIKDMLLSYGANIQSSVNKKTDILITSKNNNSSKVKKAKELGVDIIELDTIKSLETN